MNWTILSCSYLSILLLCKCIGIICSQSSKGRVDHKQVGCQQRSTLGRDYVGEANTTLDGIPCQKWSATQPHDHRFTNLGDHNFCRNPAAQGSGVWCYTTDSDIPDQRCSVPFCPLLKALDLLFRNDYKPDENNSHTHASLKTKNLPVSITICTAFMVEAWSQSTNSDIFFLRDDN